MTQLRITERAEDDISDHYAWFGLYDLKVAERFRIRSRESIEILKEYPAIGVVRYFSGRRFRMWRVKGFPKILIFYSHQAGITTVYRVLHGQRDVEQELTRGSGANASKSKPK